MTVTIDDRLVPLTPREIDDLFFGNGNIEMMVQNGILLYAIRRLDEEFPDQVNEYERTLLETMLKGYPASRDDGSSDHIVFLSGGKDRYYDMVMQHARIALIDDDGDREAYDFFEDQIQAGMRDVEEQTAPRFKEISTNIREGRERIGKKLRRKIGRWELNPLEKRLVKDGMLKLEGDDDPSLMLQRRRLSPAEKDSVAELIEQTAEELGLPLSGRARDQYMKLYRDMKKYLQLVPVFVEKLFERFEGSFVFLDRDARPLYQAANLFSGFRPNNNSSHLVPVTRPMIPELYTAAHRIQKGTLTSFDAFFMGGLTPASYHWDTNRLESIADGEDRIEQIMKDQRYSLDFKTAMESPEVLAEAAKLYSYLVHIGVLDSPNVVAVDLGVLGTAADFTADTIKRFSPETETNSHLFYSIKGRGFVKEDMPYSGLNRVDYLRFYESFPKASPTVFKFEEQEDGLWVPEQSVLTPEETKWVRGLENEVYLGARLVEEAVRNSVIQYLFDGRRAEQLIRK